MLLQVIVALVVIKAVLIVLPDVILVVAGRIRRSSASTASRHRKSRSSPIDIIVLVKVKLYSCNRPWRPIEL
jgi:hypothetical protein